MGIQCCIPKEEHKARRASLSSNEDDNKKIIINDLSFIDEKQEPIKTLDSNQKNEEIQKKFKQFNIEIDNSLLTND